MIGILILCGFIKANLHVDCPWGLALAYSLISSLFLLALYEFSVVLIALAITFLITWLFFWLLKRFEETAYYWGHFGRIYYPYDYFLIVLLTYETSGAVSELRP